MTLFQFQYAGEYFFEKKDFKSTGQCHFTTAKETFWTISGFNGVAKSSPYTETLSRGWVMIEFFENEFNLIAFNFF